MASIEKVAASGVVNWLRHNNRTIAKDSNTDIDYSRTKENICLTPYIPQELRDRYDDPKVREEIRKLEYAHYKELKEQFYCYNRKDVNTMVSVVVTLPKEITDPKTEDKFFQGISDFLCDRYGNCVSITVHKDEGKHYVQKDLDGKPILDKDGNKVREWHEGRSHLHFTFIPTVKIDHAAIAKKKNPVKEMFKYKEKINAKERLNRKELLHLHPDMNTYISEKCGIKCNLNSGITKAQGGNKTVREMKQEFDAKVINDLTVENEQLRGEVETVREELARNADATRTQAREIAAKDRQITEEQFRSAKLEQQLSFSEANRQGAIEQLREKEATIAELSSRDQTKDAIISELKNQSRTKDAVIAELQTREQTKDATIEGLQDRLVSAQERVRSLERYSADVSADKGTISQQKAEIDALRAKVYGLKTQLRTMEQTKDATIAAKESEITALKSKNAELEVKVSAKEVSQTLDQPSQSGWGSTSNNTQTVGWGQSGGWGSQEGSTTTWDVDQ